MRRTRIAPRYRYWAVDRRVHVRAEQPARPNMAVAGSGPTAREPRASSARSHDEHCEVHGSRRRGAAPIRPNLVIAPQAPAAAVATYAGAAGRLSFASVVSVRGPLEVAVDRRKDEPDEVEQPRDGDCPQSTQPVVANEHVDARRRAEAIPTLELASDTASRTAM